MNAFELFGHSLAHVAAPLTYATSFLREKRLFHARGECFAATAENISLVPYPWRALARRLTGPVLVRLSSAFWERADGSPDFLGCALRFGWDPEDSLARPTGAQDVLLDTFRRLATLPIDLFNTDPTDFSQNAYFAAAKFAVAGAGPASFRAVPAPDTQLTAPFVDGANRWDRLDRQVAAGALRFRLQLRAEKRWSPWIDLVELNILRRIAIDENALRFSPFHDARGIHPVGFLNAIRRATYAAGQEGRQLANPPKPEKQSAHRHPEAA